MLEDYLFSEVRHPRLLHEDWTPDTGKHYCAICIDTSRAGDGWGASTVRSHLKTEHGIGNPVDGVFVLTGEQLWARLIEWRRANAMLGERAALVFQSLCGVEDFLFECGVGWSRR